MRMLLRVTMVGFAATLVASPVVGQRADSQINPRSAELLRQGEAHLAAGRFNEADDALETALAVDPRNRAAFVVLARVASKQKLYGQAIRFTNRALALEPNDLDALAVQGEAMVELGAVARAQQNLVKLQRLCPSGCGQLSSLSAAISRGQTVAAATRVPQTKSN
ncbi:MAG TPA: tetratricopeptide repeat protein [Sphingomicrobium sp.]|nr:tetratricopeptide repeat protein [Sphingomicrobium sp.]